MILIELTAAVNAAGALKTFYLSTGSFQTSPIDTPANTAFVSRAVDPGSLGLHAFSDGRTSGGSSLETGEIVISNLDGRFDAWVNYSFDGQPVVIRSGEAGAYPSAFPVVHTATVESLEATWSQIVVRLKDKQLVLQQPLLTALYGGTNVLPAGVDGLPGDLKGHARPLGFGKVLQVLPPQVNTSKLIYETGVCSTVDAVYDGGLPLTAGAAYASQADMEANAPSAGQYRAWTAGGYIRLGSSVAGALTVDFSTGANAAARTAGQVLRAIALAAGLTAGEVSAADVAALDALNSAVVGTWVAGDGDTAQAAMDEVAASVGAWYGFDSVGVLRMGRLDAPSGVPALEIGESRAQKGLERRPPRDNGRPVWSVTVNHTKIWTVQESGLLGAATAAMRGYLARERRASNSKDATIKTQWKLAESLQVDGLLTQSADADAEAARLLAIYRVRRDIYDVPVSATVFINAGLRLMSVVSLRLPRFDLTSGKLMRVVGYRLELASNRVILTLWG
jgi:hypothetical protein